MATHISIIGTGGVTVAGLRITANMAAASNGGLVAGLTRSVMSTSNTQWGGSPPELRTTQWGLMRFEVKPRSEDTA